MKYGESLFDIAYLIFAIVAGVIVLSRRKDKVGKLMGTAALALGCGDAFHLVPRVMNYFVQADFTMWLGIGKMVTSITMTLFYLMLLYLNRELSGKDNSVLQRSVIVLTVCRIFLCLLPGNRWMTNDGTMLWAVLRNVPFIIIGILTVIVFYRGRNDNVHFRNMWIYITLSFAFYIPVAVGASIVPMLGMLMLPKTICYVLMLVCFLRESKITENVATTK